MKPQAKRSKCEVVLVVITIIITILVGSGCTWTVFRPPMELKCPQQSPVSKSEYRYYVIDDYSKTPDAYFETKEAAEKYKTYFKDNHNYTVVQQEGVMYE